MRSIETEADLAAGLAALIERDARLARLAAIAGPLPLRRRNRGFEDLAAIVTNQQISNVASAAIWRRVTAAIDPFTAEHLLSVSEDTLRAAGLSRPKIRTLTGVARAVADGFAFEPLHTLPPDEAIVRLTALRGVGPWTAEIYLLFCAGHPDVFPAGDLALRIAAHEGLRLRTRPEEKAFRKMAERWAPWRGIAAFLLWEYYRARRTAAAPRPAA
jgi:DNA-3-methyladenine glycosylase II